ncbi:hypothetical protein CKO18_01520 [Rhodoferax fermentans]|uniref:Glycosyl transferase family 25 domain-containing protein n=1 Tax=Rhodoferax fermentans TaxID=28066 RepID=A0A1T1AT65_RHOFE|nr:hypothetical protein [Rhodoferax fermentans]OOV07294.1 hypothetical protein RF819_11640 [Rhodoferax fermentans]
MQVVPVFVVSLKTASDRRAALKSHLDDLGIQFEWIDAIRGDALSPQYRQEVNPTGNMSPGQLGCYLSHIHIYERIIEQALPVALVLEDDTVLHPSVKNLVATGCQHLEFDYCFLGSDDRGDAGFVFYNAATPAPLSKAHLSYPLSSGPFCTHAYLITLEGAKKRLACAYPARSAIDHYHHLPYTPRLMAVVPMLAFVNELSAVQSMSSLNWSGLQTMARKYWWYYPLRDVLKLKGLKKWLACRHTRFPHPGQWRPFESAFRVVRTRWLKEHTDAS